MVKVTINGSEFPVEEIKRWETKRVAVSRKLLERKLKRPISAANAEELAATKAEIPPETIRSALKGQFSFTGFMTGIVVWLSGRGRKISVTEIDVDFCDSKTLRRLYDDMMLNNTEENRRCCLRANPDHYLLRGTGENVQEVIEITGGLPVVSLFDIHYGDFNGLQSKQEADYPYQAAGVSYLKNGLAIGAVRHQMKDTESGCCRFAHSPDNPSRTFLTRTFH
jgi:hypothetical protein